MGNYEDERDPTDGGDRLLPEGDTPSVLDDGRARSAGLPIVATDEYADPLGEFAAEPFHGSRDRGATLATPRVEASPPVNDYVDLPLMPPDVAGPLDPAPLPSTRSWEPFAVMGGGVAAFAAGAILYATYPAWLATNERSPVTVSQPAEPDAAPEIRPTEREVERKTRNDETEAASSKAPRAESTPRVLDRAEAPRPKVTAPASAADVAVPSLSGEWSMNTRVESSRLQRYEGLRLQYQLRLQQVGDSVTGTGYKLRENDRDVATQTPITLKGDVEGDRVVLTFQEGGTRRASAGKLVLHRESHDVLRGRFSSDAAQSTGTVDARR